MKAVIMAGGEGTRLRPLTCNRPKPMVPVLNRPVMEHIVNLLKKHRITDIAVTLQYMPQTIREYFEDGTEFGADMRYFVEETPLGTAGSVKNAESFLDGPFIVISGDALTDIDLTKAIAFHKEKKSVATLILKPVEIPLEYGVVVTEKDGSIIRFLEKPSWGEVFSDTANTGIYILEPEVLGYIRKNEMFDFSKDVFPQLLKLGKPMFGYITEEYWCDIGDLAAYRQANMDAMEGKVRIEIPGKMIKEGIWVEEGAVIDEGAIIKAPCFIGSCSHIKRGANLEQYCIIGDYCILDEYASVKRSILWDHCHAGKSVQLRGAILCSKVKIKDRASCYEQSIIGSETIVEEKAVVKPNIKIWPNKYIDAGTEVNANLVWGSKFTRNLFGSRGIAGEINVDITPEFASKLGAAYGATLKGKARIGISCDTSRASHMLKISFIAGMLSSGLDVYDIGEILLPMCRSAVRFYKLDGGIHISTSTGEDGKLYIDFLDSNGANINRGLERKIETAFVREDFSRCEGNCIREVILIHDYRSYYVRSIINSTPDYSFDFKVIVNSRSEFVRNTFSHVLKEKKCEVEVTDWKVFESGSVGEAMPAEETGLLREQVLKSKADLGVSIDETCEKMILVDETGQILSGDMMVALFSLISFRSHCGGTVVVPLSATHAVEKMAEEYSGKVMRTKTSVQAFMDGFIKNNNPGASGIGSIWNGKNSQGEEMLEQFLMHFDALSGMLKILDYLKSGKHKMSELVKMIPSFYVEKRSVSCPWNAKGKVIKELSQEKEGGRIETTEGVKVFRDGGWVLVLPDAERPVCNIISEGYSAEFAQELSSIYEKKVLDISRSGES